MKKIASLILLLVCICTASYAQLNLGLKLSWNINQLIIKTANANEEFFRPNGFEESLSLGGGLMAKYRWSHRFSIQSELIFDAFKTDFAKRKYYTNSLATYNRFNVDMNYLELPFMAKVSFGSKATFDIFAGSYVGYLLSAKQSSYNGKLAIPQQLIPIDYPPQDVRRGYTSFNAGVLAGLGVTMDDRIVLEFRLNRGLININKAGSPKVDTLQGQFTVGWYMFRQKKKTSL